MSNDEEIPPPPDSTPDPDIARRMRQLRLTEAKAMVTEFYKKPLEERLRILKERPATTSTASK